MRGFILFFWLGLSFSAAAAQSSSGPAFEVVSIHVHPQGQPGKLGFYSSPGGGVELDTLTLSRLVGYALDIDDQRVFGVPDWANSMHYDVKATPPDDSPSRKLNLPGHTATPTPEQRAMILNMLVERFGLKFHEEMTEMPVYVLKRGKGPLKLDAPKFPERAADPRGGLVMIGDLVTGQGFGQSLTMGFLVKQLEWPLERPVIDQTGIEGVYDFRVAPIEPENKDKLRGAQLMVDAIGLKLAAGRAPVRTIRVDAATPPTEN